MRAMKISTIHWVSLYLLNIIVQRIWGWKKKKKAKPTKQQQPEKNVKTGVTICFLSLFVACFQDFLTSVTHYYTHWPAASARECSIATRRPRSVSEI